MKYYLVYLFNGKIVQIDSFDNEEFYTAIKDNSETILREYGQGHCSDNKLFNEVQAHTEIA